MSDISILKRSWSVTFGGKGNDSGNSVQETSDGGYIVAEYMESLGARNQILAKDKLRISAYREILKEIEERSTARRAFERSQAAILSTLSMSYSAI